MNHLSDGKFRMIRRKEKVWNFSVVFFGLLYSLYVSFTVAGKYIPNYNNGGILYALVLGIATGIVVGFVVGGFEGIFWFGSIIFPGLTIANAVVTTIIIAAIYPNGLPEWFSLIPSHSCGLPELSSLLIFHPSGFFEWLNFITALIPGTLVGTYLLCTLCSE